MKCHRSRNQIKSNLAILFILISYLTLLDLIKVRKYEIQTMLSYIVLVQ